MGACYDHLEALTKWTEEVTPVVNGVLGSRPKGPRAK